MCFLEYRKSQIKDDGRQTGTTEYLSSKFQWLYTHVFGYEELKYSNMRTLRQRMHLVILYITAGEREMRDREI